MQQKQDSESRLSTGIAGLDEILNGGLVPHRAYLLRGGPGTGKTILGLHFLIAGVQQGERALFVTLSESEEEVRQNAAALSLDISQVQFVDLSPEPEFFTESQNYDIFSPAEVEREPVTNKLTQMVERFHPQRVFVDAVTQMRYLASDEHQYRKQTLAFLRFLVDQGATVLFTSESGKALPDADLQFLSDGIIELELTDYTRTLRVTKFRGSDFETGAHAIRLTGKGMLVFPRLVPQEHGQAFVAEAISSGIPALDEVLGGGLERGTVSLITGPVGVGKTTFGLQFMVEAARRGERSVLYLFEERAETLMIRGESIGIPIKAMVEQGNLELIQIEPLQMSAHEFAILVRREVEEQKTRLIMVDSLSGYSLSLQGENIRDRLHALVSYLKNMGVTTLLINEIENITGDFRATDVGISYMADNIIFLRYLEINGEMRKAIGVLKKRLSNFEKQLRELEITDHGIQVGKPLTGLKGILSGTPEWVSPPEGRRHEQTAAAARSRS